MMYNKMRQHNIIRAISPHGPPSACSQPPRALEASWRRFFPESSGRVPSKPKKNSASSLTPHENTPGSRASTIPDLYLHVIIIGTPLRPMSSDSVSVLV